jgi:alkylation response protein AidB-like acyl-CoA dehydrogenase
VDVRLSPEQRALRDAAAKLVADLGPATVADLDDDGRSAKLDAALASTGWRELRTAGDDGAPLASAVEAALVAEELSRGLADAPFLGPTLAAELRRRTGAPAATEPETVALHAGLTRLTRGPTPHPAPRQLPPHPPQPAPQPPQPATASPPTRDAVSQVREGGGQPPQLATASHTTADGVSQVRRGVVAVDAAGAAAALLLVPAARGHSLRRVPLGAAVRTDLTRATAPLAPGVASAVPDQQRPLDAHDRDAVTALGLALTTAELVGTMRGAVELATAYAKERRQYGSPIGSFQAVQHLLADALVATEGARSLARHAAWAVDALAPADALASAAAAKAYAARAARTVCETAIQVHGGIGNTWECLAHVHLRRALLSTDVFGGVGPNLARVLEHRGIAPGGARGLR